MATSLPPWFREVFDEQGGEHEGLLSELVDSEGDIRLEVGGRTVLLPDDIRRALARLVDHRRRGENLRRLLDAVSTTPHIRLEPIVDLRADKICGYEALTELPDVGDGLPAAWFKEAAQLGLGGEVEIAAVEQAMAELPNLEPHVYLSINVSPQTATSPALAAVLRRAPAHRIVLEVTEHAQVDDYASLNAALAVLRNRGVRLAVDDAGAGFASFHHILLMRPEIVKLDVSLISDIDSDLARRALVTGLIFFAQHISATTVAEGVETAEQANALRELGIRYAQGYLYR